MANGHEGVHQCSGCVDVRVAMRVVSLGDLVNLELAGLSLGILILDTAFDVAFEDALSVRLGVILSRLVHGRIAGVAQTLHLQLLASANGVSITISLTVNVSERLSLHGRVLEWSGDGRSRSC